MSALVGGTGPGLIAAGLSLATRCFLAASADLPLGPLAIGVWLGSFSVVEVLYVYLIAARRRDEAALGRSERRFRLLTEALPQLVWATRPDGGATYFNRRWYEVTGLTPEKSLGDAWSENLHPEDRRRIIDTWDDAVRSGTAYEVECRHRCADGTYRWFLVQGVPSTDAAGRVVEWFGTCTDIEEQKRAAAALAEATRAKDEFLAVLSHELRTPLTPVLMAVTALLDDRQSCPSLRPTLKMIRDNVQLEARLIDDLLDLSRIARGQMEYRFEIVDVHALIERTIGICRGQIEGKGHHLAIELAAVEHHVRGDPARLQQVLWNLLTNAVKYTPEGGRIAIRTLSYGPGRLAIEVADDGIGIDPDHLPHLFDAFERGDGAVASHAGGLGLGLTISRSIVEAHGGTLQGASDGRDRGATFRLELATADLPGGLRGAVRRTAEPAGATLAGAARRGQRRDGGDDGERAAEAGARGHDGHQPEPSPGGRLRRVRRGGQRPRPGRRQRAGVDAARPVSGRHAGDRRERLRDGGRRAAEPGGGLRGPPGQADHLRDAGVGHPPGHRRPIVLSAALS